MSMKDQICRCIDTDFEKGLMMFKDFAMKTADIDFDTKQQIFNKLLMITSPQDGAVD